MSNKKNKDYFTIKKKAFLGIAPAAPIIGVLLSKGRAGPLMLFLIGISCGFLIGWFSRD